MMLALPALAILLLSAIFADCRTQCITVDSVGGQDLPSCLQRNFSCKTLSYVLKNSSYLNNTDVVLDENQRIHATIIVSNVKGLKLMASGDSTSTIYCDFPSGITDEGSGLVFRNVKDLSVVRVGFHGCGTLQVSTTLREGLNVKYRSAVYIINSTNIHINGVVFNNNPGKALSLFDVNGIVQINNSTFAENKVPKSELRTYFGGGGISIEFTHCTPGVQECNEFQNTWNKNSNYIIQHCVFNDNRATNDEIAAQINTVQFRKLTGSDRNNAGQGGGIHITVKGNSTGNSIEIKNCSFNNNSAQYGGGIDAVIQNNSKRNNITISGCNFTNNSALERSGGAMNFGFTSGSKVRYNTIRIEHSIMQHNSAGRGEGVSFFSSSVKTPSTNKLEFIECMLVNNSASIGAAVSLRPTAGSSLFDGEPPTPLFQRCTFATNQVIKSAAFLTSANDGETQHVVETGALHIESIEVQLKDFVSFNDNVGSAIVATKSLISILKDSVVHFINNRAQNGGAIALLGYSILDLYTGSRVVFDSNVARDLGGAVYATSSHQAEFIFSHKCFISFRDSLHPDDWNTTLYFTNNKALLGYDIYTDSLLPCAKNVFDIVTNVSSALLWSPFIYTRGIGNYRIATSPATINFSLPEEVAPGQLINISSISLDDLGQHILSAYRVFGFCG